jgi:hypothetical protein
MTTAGEGVKRAGKSAGLALLLVVSGLMWLTVTETLLASSTPTVAWIAVLVLWIEIVAVTIAFVHRYRMRRRGLGGVLVAVAVGLAVNFAAVVVLLPAVVMGA